MIKKTTAKGTGALSTFLFRFMLLAAVFFATAAQPVARARPPGGGPPPEARMACSGRSSGSECSFQAPHGTVSGTCLSMRGESVCVPSGGPEGQGSQDRGRSVRLDSGLQGPPSSLSFGRRDSNTPQADRRVVFRTRVYPPPEHPLEAVSRIPDTGQDRCFNETREIRCPEEGEPFFGQDANYAGSEPAYRDNGDGTVTDLNTGLMWSKAVDPAKVSLVEARKIAEEMNLGGYRDWRVPGIKELYSLMDFRGYTGLPERGDRSAGIPANAIPFIDTDYFDFSYGDTSSGERYIDAQWVSDTEYVSTTMGGSRTLFGVNFADGRIKGYGYERPGGRREKKFFVRFVRGPVYAQNDFEDHQDGTVTDHGTGLMWTRRDNGHAVSWKEALQYAENLTMAGHSDWRLPNAKELQSIVDYTRSPDTTYSPALDPVFQSSRITNEGGQPDFPYYWTSTTHLDGPNPGSDAAYIAFGRAIGQMAGRVMDVHGAGAQRGDPKTGEPSIGFGPQGDARRVRNYVRCVRNA